MTRARAGKAFSECRRSPYGVLDLARAARIALCAFTVLAGCAASRGDVSWDDAGPVLAANLIGAWQPDAALHIIDDGIRKDPDSRELLMLKARALYFLSDYRGALDALDGIDTLDPEETAFRQRLTGIEATARRFIRRDSEHFQMRLAPGPDEVLFDQGLQALEASFEAVGDDLGFRPDGKVIVEVYPDLDSFTLASTLSPDDIRTSGTIALCKYNRIMILSPRNLLRGYAWLDTLCHEYVHFVLWKRNTDTVPIWLHEGIAKYEERRWREDGGAGPTPTMASLLARRHREDKLVTLSEMHPSLAKLGSQEEVMLAFSEVLTMVQFLWQRTGRSGIVGVLDGLARGEDYETAVSEVWGGSFEDFMSGWRESLDRLAVEPYSDLTVTPRVFKDEKSESPASGESEELGIASVRARDLVRVAQLLEERGRDRAVVVELRKARKLGGGSSPLVGNRLASALIRLKVYDEAYAVLDATRASAPDYVTTWENLGALYMELGQQRKALNALVEATRINPFNPYTRRDLREVYLGLGLDENARREEEALKILGATR